MLRKNPKFDLKLKYRKVFEMSIIFALFLTIVAFKTFPDIRSETNAVLEPPVEITIIDITNICTFPVPPPPPIPPIPIPTLDDADDLPDIPIDDNDLNVDANVKATLLPPPIEDDFTDPLEIFIAVEEMPTPIGGITGIQKRIVYPEIARRGGVHGQVIVRAFVDENGNVFKADIFKGIGAGCDKAAIAAVLETKFRPGKQRGKAVRVQISIPIRFKLN